MSKKIPVTFEAEVLQVTELNSLLSKARVAIFEMGHNRNGSYISDEVAGMMIESLPYVPIKGIYDNELEDFTGHGFTEEGRIYGVVPENPNTTIELIKTEDGEKEYIVSDVLLFTGLYHEARQIVGKAQSMELDIGTLEGEWRITADGVRYYHYLKANFQALQIIGDYHEPCFKGSHFFDEEQSEEIMKFMLGVQSSNEQLQAMLEETQKQLVNFSLKQTKEEEENMSKELQAELDKVKADFTALEQEKTDLEAKFTADLQEKADELEAVVAEKEELTTKYESVLAERDEMVAEKEQQIREGIVSEFASLLDEVTITEVVEKFTESDNAELEKQLALATVKYQKAKKDEDEKKDEKDDKDEEKEKKDKDDKSKHTFKLNQEDRDSHLSAVDKIVKKHDKQ